MKDKIFEVIYGVINLSFAIIALTFLAPLSPFVDFHGGVLSAIALGAVLFLYQEIWKRISNKLLGVAPGSCPMPGVMKWVVLSCFAAVIIFIFALGLFVPWLYTVHGPLSAIAAGVITVIGEMLANIVAAPVRKLAGK